MIFGKQRIWEYSKSDCVKLEKILRKYEPRIGHRADIHGLKNKFNQTPLFYAVKNGSSKCVSLLLQMSNIDVMTRDYYGDTVLHLACRLNHLDIVKIILKSCKEVINVPRNNMLTPIFDAITNNNLEIVTNLMDNGACVNQTKLNEMAIELALHKKCLDIVCYLATKFSKDSVYQFEMKTLWKAINLMHVSNEMKIFYFKQIYASLYPDFDPKEENYDLDRILPIVMHLSCLIFHLLERNSIKFRAKTDIITEFLTKFGPHYGTLVILCHEDMKVLDIEMRNLICVNFIDALSENLVDDQKNVYEALFIFFRFLKNIRHLFEGNSHFKIFQQICFFMNLNRGRILDTETPDMMVISCFKEFILWTISINMITYDLLPYYKKLADFINDNRFCQLVMSTMTPEIYWDIENCEKFKRLPKILSNCLPFHILQKICLPKSNSHVNSFFLTDTEIVIQGRRRRRLANSENTLKSYNFDLNDNFSLTNLCRTVIRESIYRRIFTFNTGKSFDATCWREHVFRESICQLNLPKPVENYLIFIE